MGLSFSEPSSLRMPRDMRHSFGSIMSHETDVCKAPGTTAFENMPYLANLFVNPTENKILAVLDCA